jgi:3-oxoacyl-[acyl-carrier protein] reductase
MGIGRAIAKGLAAEGVHVAVVARRTGLLPTQADEIVAAGGKRPALSRQDLMAEDAAACLREAALSAPGKVDVLVNNAGDSSASIDAPEQRWVEATTLDLTGQRQTGHALLQYMIERHWGRISNVTGESEPEHRPPRLPPRRRCMPWMATFGAINSDRNGEYCDDRARHNRHHQARWDADLLSCAGWE